MAGLGVDTSIFTPPPQNSLIGVAGQGVGLANAAQENQLLKLNTQQSQQDVVKQQVQYLAGGLGLLAAKPDLSAADMHNFAQTAVQEGILSPQTYQAEMANVDAAGNDTGKLQALANNYRLRALDAGQQFGATVGYAPGAGGAPVQYTGPQGQTVNTTEAHYAAANGVGQPPANPLMRPAPVAASGGNPMVAPVPANSNAAGAPAPVSAPTASPALPAGGIAGPTPQQMDQFKASAQQQQDDLTADSNYTANIVPLTKTLDLLPKTPLFGAGAEVPTQVAKVLNTFGIKVGSDQAQNASELDKYLTQLARASGAAPNSDSQLAAAFSANPNMTTDKAAAQDVVKTMLSLSRMQHAKVAAAQAAGIPPEQYSTFASKWGAAQDPRAYGFDLMSPAAKTALRTELEANPAEAQKFISSYQTANQLGILGAPQQ